MAALALAACEDDAVAPIDRGPDGNPTMVISLPTPTAGAEMLCVSIGDDVDAEVPILVEVEELILRPPGICGDFLQCGHLALYANDVLNNESAVRSVHLLLRKLADRYHDSKDTLTLRVDVLNDAGDPIKDQGIAASKDDDGRPPAPLSAELTLCTVPDCNALPSCGDGVKDACEACDYMDPATPCCDTTCQGPRNQGESCGDDPDGDACGAVPVCNGEDTTSCDPRWEQPATPCGTDPDGEGCGAMPTCAPVEDGEPGWTRCNDVVVTRLVLRHPDPPFEPDGTTCDDGMATGVCCADMDVVSCVDGASMCP
jgi:hypothetical protein